ncbi:MAG: HIT family protein [Proteobacteria bacterium]|nr:HIT family protein [Pseudomonadota bacterium]
MEDCIFCKIVRGELPSLNIYENDLLIVIMDIMPLSEGHTLILPKAHHETIFDMNESLACQIMSATWKVANVINKTVEPSGLNILQNNKTAAGQVVPHYHVHLIPRNEGDGLKVGQWSAEKADPKRLETLANELRRVL